MQHIAKLLVLLYICRESKQIIMRRYFIVSYVGTGGLFGTCSISSEGFPSQKELCEYIVSLKGVDVPSVAILALKEINQKDYDYWNA